LGKIEVVELVHKTSKSAAQKRNQKKKGLKRGKQLLEKMNQVSRGQGERETSGKVREIARGIQTKIKDTKQRESVGLL